MQVEDWLEVLAPDDIRIKGTRAGIETVLYDYIHRSRTAEEIAEAYPTLTVVQVYAVLLYYHTHREAMDRYLSDWLAFGLEARERQQLDPQIHALRDRLLQARQSRPGDAA